MPDFIRITCGCGRTLRARPEQVGETIRCWSCHAEQRVPHPDRREELAKESGDIMRDAVSGETFLALVLGAAAATLALLIPRVGGWIAFAIVVVGASRYIDLIRVSGLHRSRPEGPDGRNRAVRWFWSVVAAAALVGPVVARNDGHGRALYPSNRASDGLVALMLTLWILTPLALVAAAGHDRDGPLGPRRALATLGHHPLATLGALLLPFLAVALVETYLALFAWAADWMPLMVSDLSSPPRFGGGTQGVYIHFRFGPRVFETYHVEDSDVMAQAYLRGLQRLYTFTGAIPASLTEGLGVRPSTGLYKFHIWPYLILRTVATFVILAVLGSTLLTQARLLGIIAAIEPRRPDQARRPPSASRDGADGGKAPTTILSPPSLPTAPGGP